MFKWLKRREVVIRDDAAQQICDMLFPEPTENVDDGLTFITDTSVDMNLQAALADLEEGVNDEVTRDTLRKILVRLHEARDLLKANYQIKKEARYFVVDAPPIKSIEERVSPSRD